MSSTALDILHEIEEQSQRNRSTYKPEDKLKALQTYAAYGSMQKVEKLLGIPWKTVQSWKRKDWWKNNLQAVRDEADDMLDGEFTNVVRMGTAAVVDRLEHGDVRIDKRGEQVRVPVSGRDAMIIAATAWDKRQLGRNKATSITSSQTNLEDMANMFKEYTKKQLEEKQTNSIPGEVEDV